MAITRTKTRFELDSKNTHETEREKRAAIQARFVYRRTFFIDGKRCVAVSCNDGLYDRIKISTDQMHDTELIFSPHTDNSYKVMVADAMSMDRLWLKIIEKRTTITISDNDVYEILELQKRGLAGAQAVTFFSYFNTESNKGSALRLYERFLNAVDETALVSANQARVLMIYADLFIRLTPEFADRLLKISTSLNKLRALHKEAMRNTWSLNLVNHVMKMPIEVLSYVLEFRFKNSVYENTWSNQILEIAAEMSAKDIEKAKRVLKLIHTKDSHYWKKYKLFLNQDSASNSELARIASIMLVKYDYKTLVTAENILNHTFDFRSKSIEKLMAVTRFLHNGGNPSTPVHWMLEFT